MSIRDRAGRFQGHDKVSSNGEAMADQAQPIKPSRKDELHVALKNEQEHDQLQQAGIQFLHTIGDARKSIEDRTSDTLFNWFKHQGFWPEWWHPSMAVAHGFIEPSDEQTVEIPLVEYIRLKKMEKLGLIVTEVAECMEAVRKDDHRNEVEELADIDVRMHDYKGGFGLAEYGNPFKDTAADGFIQKMIANFSRPFRHGKKF